MKSKFSHKASATKKASGGIAETIKTVVYAVLIALVVRTVAYEPFNIPSGSMVPTLLIGDYLFVSKFSYGYSRYSLPFGLPLFSGRVPVPGLSHPPQRGDVVVFKVPTNNSTDFIKRIIGLPGDTIQMRRGELYIDGKEVPRRPDPACRNREAFLGADGFVAVPVRDQIGFMESLPRGPGKAPLQHCIIKTSDNGLLNNTPVYDVPPGHYFMMGDNRDNSEDSRVGFGAPGAPESCLTHRADAMCYVRAQNLIGKAEFLFFSTRMAIEPNAYWWQIWKWPFAIRYGRLFHGIH